MTVEDVRIFDTTLRDGEQAAGVNLNLTEKLQVAHQLARLRVDIIEAGFPAASPGDFQSVQTIAREVPGLTVAGLARTRKGDIEAAFEALKDAGRPRIHTFIATSPIHREFKLKMSREEVLEQVRTGVEHARSLVEDVEFSAEDASRSEPDFLAEVFRTAVEHGATTLNIPDTVGYATPEEFGAFVEALIREVAAPKNVAWSVHCHNDLGMAVANSLAAVRMGVRQVECTVNGLGERAGNASMEEIVMALQTRTDRYGARSRVDTTKLYGTSKLVSRLTGVRVPPNKAIVGDNAFAHEAGIHQHGMLCNRATYEIMKPEDVGAPGTALVLGKHSGRHAFRDRLEALGYHLDEDQIDKAFGLFKDLCDRKKTVSDGDIEALVADEVVSALPERRYDMVDFGVQVSSGRATASITLRRDGQEITDAAAGNGPVDAAYEAIKRIVGLEPELREFRIHATSEQSDSVGETVVVLRHEGVNAQGRGASTDVIESAIKAYVSAVNRLHVVAAAKEVNLYGTDSR